MRIYKHIPIYTLRISIAKQGEQTYYISVCDCTPSEFESFAKNIIEKQNISIFNEGKKIAINIREADGSKNGKSTSFSFKGLSTLETYNLLIKNIPTK